MSNTTTAVKTTKPCPITLAQFKAAAPKLYVTLDRGDVEADAVLYAAPKKFSSGSVGLWDQGKVHPRIGGLPVPCQIGVNMVLCGTGVPSAKAAEGGRIQPPQEVRDQAYTQLKGVRVGLTFVAAGQTPPTGAGVYEAMLKAPFMSGSFGWNVSAKLPVFEGELQGEALQVGINVTCCGSKPATAPKAAD